MNLDLFDRPILPESLGLRIPYMGSKNKIAVELFQKMLEIYLIIIIKVVIVIITLITL
jgi:hypothetical protein